MIFTDIDNTIIFSHRHDIDRPKVLVELLDGKEQSYMPEDGFILLQGISPDRLVPVTTRTKKQYDRIKFYRDGRIPHLALTDNGGMLLVDGREDWGWYNETRTLCSSSLPYLLWIKKRYEDRAVIKMPDSLFLFIKGNCIDEIKRDASDNGLMTFMSGEKFYVCPKELSKGIAIKRLMERYPETTHDTICAGDSTIDLSMAGYTYEAYFSDALSGYMTPDIHAHFIKATDIAETIFRKEAEFDAIQS